MPEEETGGTGTETERTILTQEDRERISILVGRILRAQEHFELSETSELLSQLHQEGGKAADYILTDLEGGGLPMDEAHRYITMLDNCASPREAERIGQLLTTALIALDGADRSNKCGILNILKSIGIPENASQVVAFAEMVGGDRSLYGPYYNRLVCADRERALFALEGILGRTEKEGERASVQEAIDRVQASIVAAETESGSDWHERRGRPAEPLVLDEAFLRFDAANDRAIEEDYRERRFYDVGARLQTVRDLRHEARKEKGIAEEPEDDDTMFLRRHWLEYREEHPSPYAPTLGIEIEIREQTFGIPEELSENAIYKICNEQGHDSEQARELRRKRLDFYDKKQKLYRRTEEIGVPRGNDKFWEFVHRPVENYLTLSREVQALIEMGLISKEDQRHPLHLTIGGISAMRDFAYTGGRNDADVLARALEASAWSVRGRRLLRPYYSKRSAWTIKGQGGIKERPLHELELNVRRGVEFRTFQLQTLTGLDRLLRSAFLLGAALKAYQERGEVASSDENINKLSDIWRSFSAKTKVLFYKFGLPKPNAVWENPNPYDESQRSEFVPFAKLIDEGLENPKSGGAEFIREMRKLIIAARAEIAKIVYPEKGETTEEQA